MQKLKNKVALITGGSSGIGLATARKFVEEGAYVFIVARRQKELDEAVAEIGKNVMAIQGDIANMDDLDRIYRKIVATKGKLDIVFANAGAGMPTPFEAATPEAFDAVFSVNVKGTFFTIQKSIALLNNGASIILVGSGVAHKGYPNSSLGASAKTTLRSFVRVLTTELTGRGIRANLISPGAIDTGVIDRLVPDKATADQYKQYFISITPMARMGRPEEIANAALFLASDDSSYITGIELPVDGGAVQV